MQSHVKLHIGHARTNTPPPMRRRGWVVGGWLLKRLTDPHGPIANGKEATASFLSLCLRLLTGAIPFAKNDVEAPVFIDTKSW